MELSEEISEPKRGAVIQSTSKRVRMIFSVMASPNRIDILRILNSKGPLTYSELKSLAGFKSKKESGKFAYHLRKLLRQQLVALNKAERRYTITNLGKLVLSLARQIEERSVIESGKMYVRTSHDSIEEFDSNKISRSLAREGGLPLELAQKITEEVENRIYKYQTAYLTGSLIREMVNTVLIEHGHEEYRNKLVRLGLPVYDVKEMITNVDNVDSGAAGLLAKTGRVVFTEHLLTDTLPKDMADNHLAGELHITNPGVWSLLPDILFANIKELIEDGLNLGGKFLDVSRIRSIKTLDDLTTALSMMISLISKEASQEVVLDGLQSLLSKHSKNISELESKLTNAFASASTVSKYTKDSTLVSFRVQLGSDTKIVAAIISAYKNYTKITPVPRVGLVIDHEKGKLSDVSTSLAEIISTGGKLVFAKGNISNKGIIYTPSKGSTLSINLQSVSINMPRLAFESNKDVIYFRAKLALLMNPILTAMAMRKKDISDLTRRGLNPILAQNTQYMQRGGITLLVNLIGLHEAVFSILGCKENDEGRKVLHQVIETAVDIAKKKSKELGDDVKICMTESDGSSRFVTLDGEKYGKNSILKEIESDSYSEGIVLDAADVPSLTAKAEVITESNKVSKILNGGLLVTLNIANDSSTDEIKKAIEKTAQLTPVFRPQKQVLICGECGFKDEKMTEKCPNCKSPYII